MRGYLDGSMIEHDEGAGALDASALGTESTAASPSVRPSTLPLVARMIARVLTAQAMPASELPALIARVGAAVSELLDPPPTEPIAEGEVTDQTERPARRRTGRRRRRRRAVPGLQAAYPSVEAPPLPAPRLVRRAEALVTAASLEAPATNLQAPARTVRGVVRWFDPSRQTGSLRLPGIPEDVPVEAGVVAQSGIARLFKGQEIIAEVDRTDGSARITAIALPGATATRSSAIGMVAGGRRSRVVIVEKKRDALKRVAARSEAEQLLGSTSDPDESR